MHVFVVPLQAEEQAMNLKKAIVAMESAAIKAGQMLCSIQTQSKRLQSRKDFLTDADLASERIILNALARDYPDIPVLSEEKGGEERHEGLLWIVDPIDGTVNYFLQDDHWGVSIALVENGRSVAGVVCLPARGLMFSATKNSLATQYPVGRTEKRVRHSPLSVSGDAVLSASQFWIGWGKEESGGADHERVYEVIKKLDRGTLYPQIRLSATADMMAVARGRIAGFVFPKPDPFDIAAAGLIVERAGGTVTEMDGSPWHPFSRTLVASNRHVHKELLSLLNADKKGSVS